MTYQIEDNIPFPQSRGRGREAGPLTIMFRKMTHGQSFFVEADTMPRNIYNRLSKEARKTRQFKVVTRKEQGGWRFWKVETKGKD